MSQKAHPVPTWRREPHRLLFPLGAALAVIAVLPFAVGGAGGGALALFHSVAQILGFLTCFITGFLFTFVPRQTHAAPPRPWEMIAALTLPPAAVLAAWADDPVMPHWLWLLLVGVLISFTLERAWGRRALRRLPGVFLWVPLSLAAGGAGAVLAALGPKIPIGGGQHAWELGRGLLVQGMVAGLVLGVSGLLVPQLTRGDDPPATSTRPRRALVAHALAAAGFFGSFPLEVLYDFRFGNALRAAIALAVLLGVARIHRLPTLPGVHRKLIWLSVWLVPLAFAMAAAAPSFRGAALHVLFVGGFAQLTLAVATHVVVAPGPHAARASGSPVAAWAMAALLAAAFGARIVATIDLRHVASWLAVAALAFCGAIAAWAGVVLSARAPQKRTLTPS